jgi:hypothetical protein
MSKASYTSTIHSNPATVSNSPLGRADIICSMMPELSQILKTDKLDAKRTTWRLVQFVGSSLVFATLTIGCHQIELAADRSIGAAESIYSSATKFGKAYEIITKGPASEKKKKE